MIFQFTYTSALSEGNVSIAVMFATFGMIFPVIISCTVFGETPSLMRAIGIALTVLAFIVTVKPSGKGTRRALVFSVIAMIANGVIQSIQKFFGASEYSSKNFTFVSASYLLSFVFTICVYLIFALRGKKKTFRTERRMALDAAATGITLGIFLALNTYAAAAIDGTFLFPAHSGGAIILSTVSGLIFFRDKLSLRQIISSSSELSLSYL